MLVPVKAGSETLWVNPEDVVALSVRVTYPDYKAKKLQKNAIHYLAVDLRYVGTKKLKFESLSDAQIEMNVLAGKVNAAAGEKK